MRGLIEVVSRVHHFPTIFELPLGLGHPTVSGFDIAEHVYELLLNLNNFCNMYVAKENWIDDARRAARRVADDIARRAHAFGL